MDAPLPDSPHSINDITNDDYSEPFYQNRWVQIGISQNGWVQLHPLTHPKEGPED